MLDAFAGLELGVDPGGRGSYEFISQHAKEYGAVGAVQGSLPMGAQGKLTCSSSGINGRRFLGLG